MKQKNHKKKKTLKQQQSLSEHMNHSTRPAGADTQERGPVQNNHWRWALQPPAGWYSWLTQIHNVGRVGCGHLIEWVGQAKAPFCSTHLQVISVTGLHENRFFFISPLCVCVMCMGRVCVCTKCMGIVCRVQSSIGVFIQ